MSFLLQLLANGFVNGVLFALLACGFGLVYQVVRTFHIAYAGVFLLGPYAAFALQTHLGLPLPLALAAGVIACVLSSVAIERFFYLPFTRRNSSESAVLIASLGMFIIIENVVVIIFGDETQLFARPAASALVIGPVRLTSIQLWQTAVGLAGISLFLAAVRFLQVFRIIRAMSDEPSLFPVLGLPTGRYRVLVFAVSGLLGGLSACLIAVDTGIRPHVGLTYLLLAVVIVLTGGIDRVRGWVAVGFLLSALQSLTVWAFSARWTDLVTFATLVVALVVQPRGFFSFRRRLEET